MNKFEKNNQHFFSLRNIIGFIISFICIYWSFANFNLNKFYQYFQSINYYYFIIAIVALIGSVIIRSIRWSLFFKKEELQNLSLLGLFKNEMIGYFGNNIFPLKLGDLLRVSIMSRTTKMSKAYLLGTIALERIIDIMSLAVLTLFFLIFYSNNFEILNLFPEKQIISLKYILICIVLFFIILLGIYSVIKNKKNLINWNLFFSPFKNINNYKKGFTVTILSLAIWFIYLFNIILISYS